VEYTIQFAVAELWSPQFGRAFFSEEWLAPDSPSPSPKVQI
jgi:hypothetical protein